MSNNILDKIEKLKRYKESKWKLQAEEKDLDGKIKKYSEKNNER